jgi:hypothetical protein
VDGSPGRRADTAILTAPAADDPDRLLDTDFIKADLGGISNMTLWRLGQDPDPEIRFPDPDLVIGDRKRLWRNARYREWKARLLERKRIKLARKSTAKQTATADANEDEIVTA